MKYYIKIIAKNDPNKDWAIWEWNVDHDCARLIACCNCTTDFGHWKSMKRIQGNHVLFQTGDTFSHDVMLEEDVILEAI